MTKNSVDFAFEEKTQTIPVECIQPLRIVGDVIKRTVKYAAIAASIKEVGIVEPPVVSRDRSDVGKYLLLDGHIRMAILKEAGVQHVTCLVATDDEAYTYNKRVNRLALVQEVRMIAKVIDRGVPEQRIAKALNLGVQTLRRKKSLLARICPEAAELLKDRHVSAKAMDVLKKMAPMRQIESAELMIAMNKYNGSYALSLLAATPRQQLVAEPKGKKIKGLTDRQIELMERESKVLDQEFKVAERTYGTDYLQFVLTKAYVSKLVGNAKVVGYLAEVHQDILSEFQKLAALEYWPAQERGEGHPQEA